MPRVLTDAYRNATFILPFTEDKSEYAIVKPLTDSMLSELRIQANKEGGADENLANNAFIRLVLSKSIVGWQGFYDAVGNNLDFSLETIKQICACDPDFAANVALRIRNVARLGELEERKN